MSKRSGDHSYQPGSACGWTTKGRNKERFMSEDAAKKAARRKRKWRNKDLPYPFLCPDCHGWHLGKGSALD